MNQQKVARKLIVLANSLLAECYVNTKFSTKNKNSSSKLYHVTRYENAANILKHDYFRSSKGLRFEGLSTTTNPNYWWGEKQVRFVLDRNKLEKDYDLIDEDEGLSYDTGEKLDESEVVVLSNKAIKNAKKYIKIVEYKPSPKDRDFIYFLDILNKVKLPSKEL